MSENYRRVLVIGDMHGNFDRLLSVFRKTKWNNDEDFLILLGDYVDRGPDNMRCLRWAMEMSQKKNVVALRGNHEEMMLAYYLSDQYADIWLPNGGNKTKRDLDEWRKKEPDALKIALTFIAERPYFHKMTLKGEEYIFCHAGLKPDTPFEEQTTEDLLWIRDEFYRNYSGKAHVVVGHTPIQYFSGNLNADAKPLKLGNKIILMDTGSFLPKGHISCMDVLSGQIWQSD